MLAGEAGRVLVGFDFPFGYPAGSWSRLRPALAARLAGLIRDEPDGANNRFAVAAQLNAQLNPGELGPFRGCPAHLEVGGTYREEDASARPFLSRFAAGGRPPARAGHPVVLEAVHARPVGSQVLMGLPAVHRLATDPRFAERTRIWPFETNWDADLDGIVIAEIWPSLLELLGNRPSHQGRAPGDRRLRLGTACRRGR